MYLLQQVKDINGDLRLVYAGVEGDFNEPFAAPGPVPAYNPDNQIPEWTGTEWQAIDDYRGKKAYRHFDCLEVTINYVAGVRKGYILLPPGPFESWNYTSCEWQFDISKYRAYKKARCIESYTAWLKKGVIVSIEIKPTWTQWLAGNPPDALTLHLDCEDEDMKKLNQSFAHFQNPENVYTTTKIKDFLNVTHEGITKNVFNGIFERISAYRAKLNSRFWSYKEIIANADKADLDNISEWDWAIELAGIEVPEEPE